MKVFTVADDEFSVAVVVNGESRLGASTCRFPASSPRKAQGVVVLVVFFLRSAPDACVSSEKLESSLLVSFVELTDVTAPAEDVCFSIQQIPQTSITFLDRFVPQYLLLTNDRTQKFQRLIETLH